MNVIPMMDSGDGPSSLNTKHARTVMVTFSYGFGANLYIYSIIYLCYCTLAFRLCHHCHCFLWCDASLQHGLHDDVSSTTMYAFRIVLILACRRQSIYVIGRGPLLLLLLPVPSVHFTHVSSLQCTKNWTTPSCTRSTTATSVCDGGSG